MQVHFDREPTTTVISTVIDNSYLGPFQRLYKSLNSLPPYQKLNNVTFLNVSNTY